MAAISKTEYLKRYLSSSVEEEKRKKRKKKPKASQKFARSVIVDDDVSLADLRPKNDEDIAKQSEFDNAGDEAPVVYDEDGVVAISLDLYKKREEDQRTKWAPITIDGEAQDEGKRESDATHVRQRNRRHDSPDVSPPRCSRADSADNSPRRRRYHGSPESSRKRTNDVPSRGGDSRHLSNQKSSRRDSSPSRGNSSPSHTRRSRHDSLEPTHSRRQRHNSSDASPVRTTRHSSDQSQQRRARHDSSDLSPPRGGKDSDSDQSPPRRSRQDSSDLSPPRGRGSDSDISPPRKRRAPSTERKPDRKAGLLSAADLKYENDLTRKREAEAFAKMDSNVSGRGAKTVHRDKSGRRRDLEAEEQKKIEEAKIRAKEDEKFNAWGRGVTQTHEAKKNMEEYLHEVDKPLARYKDDKDLDAMLKQKERNDDPMLAYMQKKKTVAKKKTGVKEKPTYKGPLPEPNRFKIAPGYRWDGVDRSNGFERKRFAMLANKRATEKIAHKWSIEEM